MKEKICSLCGTNISQFYKTGMLGCPECYNAFRQEIEDTLENIQGDISHVGKKPTVDSDDREKLNYYNMLRKEREQASLEGRFSDMTKISLEIMELKEELKEKGLV